MVITPPTITPLLVAELLVEGERWPVYVHVIEHPANEDAQARALTEQEFAEAEAYEAKWHEEDKKRYHEERLP